MYFLHDTNTICKLISNNVVDGPSRPEFVGSLKDAAKSKLIDKATGHTVY